MWKVTFFSKTQILLPDFSSKILIYIFENRFQQAWDTCNRLNDRNEWLKLAESALVNLNLEIGKY